jgi:hypothetical protein
MAISRPCLTEVFQSLCHGLDGSVGHPLSGEVKFGVRGHALNDMFLNTTGGRSFGATDVGTAILNFRLGVTGIRESARGLRYQHPSVSRGISRRLARAISFT